MLNVACVHLEIKISNFMSTYEYMKKFCSNEILLLSLLYLVKKFRWLTVPDMLFQNIII